MREMTFSRRLLVALAVLPVILIAFMTTANDAQASRKHKKGGVVYQGPRHGKVVRHLPPGHRPAWVGKKKYFYHGGAFYKRGPCGYVVVRPPRGAVVVSLPMGYRHWVAGGVSYYNWGNVYYRRVPAGYQVTEPPVQAPPAYMGGERVWVNIPVLNVRSGPGVDHRVVRQVNQGDELFVQDEIPGWLYVQLPDGRFGWVMTEYTTAQLVRAGG